MPTDAGAGFVRLLSGVRPTEARLSPDASACVVLARALCTTPEAGYRSGLWIAATDGAGVERLPTGEGECATPRWSPAGDAIAFGCDRGHPGRMAVHLWRRASGEAGPLADLPGSVEAIEWSGDGNSLLVLVAEAGADTAGADTGVTLTAGGGPADPEVMRPGQGGGGCIGST